jgi:hypothetical protein
MAKYDVAYLTKAHGHSSNHADEIKQSDLCACFYCLKRFSPGEIKEWVKEPSGDFTAICPYCDIDSLIGSKSTFPISDDQFLSEMQAYWFST